MWKFYRRTRVDLIEKLNMRPKGHIAHMRNRSPWKRTWPFITWIYFIQGCLVPCLVEIGSAVREKKIFKFRQYIFVYFPSFVFISPCKRMWSFIWTNMNPLHPKMLCKKLGWNWPSGSWEEEEENVKNLRQLQRRQRRCRRQGQQTNCDQKSNFKKCFIMKDYEDQKLA